MILIYRSHLSNTLVLMVVVNGISHQLMQQPIVFETIEEIQTRSHHTIHPHPYPFSTLLLRSYDDFHTM